MAEPEPEEEVEEIQQTAAALAEEGYTPEEIFVRVDKVDRVNAQFVEQSKRYADYIVPAASF